MPAKIQLSRRQPKAVRMRDFVTFLLVMSCCVAGVANADVACPKSPGFRLSDQAQEQCVETEGSVEECESFVELLENVENPTAQQRFDLLYGLMVLINREKNVDRMEALERRSFQLSRELHEEYPKDVQIMWHLSVAEDEDTRLKFKRRIAELTPDCNRNNYWLSVVLNRLTGHGWDRAQQDEELVQELVSVLDQGYEHGETRWDKMHFGHLRYREHLLAGDQELAKQFWNRVVTELDPGNFPYQDNTLSNGWDLLCGEMGFDLRFAEICLNTIKEALEKELPAKASSLDGAFYGARVLARTLLFGKQFAALNHAPPDMHEVSFRLYRASEGARILIRLRDLLESVPEDRRTIAFCNAYKYVLGKERQQEIVAMGCEAANVYAPVR